MRFAIIGGGNTGQAVAAYIASKGGNCIINTRDKEKANFINSSGITTEGDLIGNFKLNATTNMEEAILDSDIILIMTVANAHREVAMKLKPYLKDNQKVLIFNSNWGALQFKQVLGEDIEKKNLTVGETGTQLFVASSNEPGYVKMSIKESVYVSTIDSNKTQPLIDEIKEYFPQFEKANSIIETTISTTNPVIHVPIALLNGARIENGESFLFYGDGASRAAVDLITNIDKERVAVAKTLGCEITDVLTGINSFWEIKHDNLFDALTKNETYLKAKGPESLNHRYFSEDIPFGIAPIAKLGKIFNIKTPYTDSLLSIIGTLYGKDLIEPGIELSKEDFK